MGHHREPTYEFPHYTKGEDQTIVRSEVLRQTTDIVARSSAAVARSTAMLERLRVKQESEAPHRRQIGALPFK